LSEFFGKERENELKVERGIEYHRDRWREKYREMEGGLREDIHFW
jgi:transposase